MQPARQPKKEQPACSRELVALLAKDMSCCPAVSADDGVLDAGTWGCRLIQLIQVVQIGMGCLADGLPPILRPGMQVATVDTVGTAWYGLLC